MKIQYCSDLHLEFPQNKNFLKENPIMPQGDILLLAGDIVPLVELNNHIDFFKYLSDNFKKTFYVPGNHEFYHYNLAQKRGSFCDEIAKNVFLANNFSIVESGIKFILSTLWTSIRPINALAVANNMNDFHVISYNGRVLSTEVFSELHIECRDYIANELLTDEGLKTVVVSHHIPTYLNYPERFKGDLLNEAFAVELYDLIENSGPDYWVYGHHHANIPEFEIGKTKLINNQLGYVKYNEHKMFVPGLYFKL